MLSLSEQIIMFASWMAGTCILCVWPVGGMKQKRHSDKQIAFALRQVDGGKAVEEIYRKLGISEAMLYRWKKRFAGMGTVEISLLGPALAVPGHTALGRRAKTLDVPRPRGHGAPMHLLAAGPSSAARASG